jgi:preprotein translocase subunit SecD
MRPVVAVSRPSDASYPGTTVTCGDEGGPDCTATALTEAPSLVLAGEDGNKYRLGRVVLDGNDVAGATAIRSPFGGEWAVECELTTEGVDRFDRATGRDGSSTSPHDSIAIVVGGLVVSAPSVSSAVRDGRVEITGAFTEAGATTLAAQLGGSPP